MSILKVWRRAYVIGWFVPLVVSCVVVQTGCTVLVLSRFLGASILAMTLLVLVLISLVVSRLTRVSLQSLQ